MKSYEHIINEYEGIKKSGVDNLNSNNVFQNIKNLAFGCQEYLSSCGRIELISKVADKAYFSFNRGNKSSRAIRNDLFTTDNKLLELFLDCLNSNEFNSISNDDLDKAGYTIAISFCAVIDIEKVGDQKTPGTFFEYFMGHCFAKKLNVNPENKVDVLNLDMEMTLPTDLIFDLGPNKPKFHVPVKTSTRERVIQVWAHQRVLDGVYGSGRFIGVLACLSETKLNKKRLEVVEICLPNQWRLYQLYIAQMKGVYYLDLPEVYAKLNLSFPKIHVKTFSSFFKEPIDVLLTE